ncbi:MAG: S-layer homology domain-containing protein, partial [Acidobacteria bacterium]|nr:S-layer homology domain-containing protein [Acidobacteriota bacterium]
GTHEVRNLKVYDNIIVSSWGETGIGRSGSSNNNIFTSWGNKFYDNTYYFDNLNAKYYRWKYSAMSRSQWQSNNNDQAGIWLRRSLFVMPILPSEGQGWTGPGGGGGGDGGGSATFTDTTDSVFESDIEWLADQGITNGCNPPTNTRFCPDDRVTRGQMAAFLDRALNLPATSQNYFTDDDGSSFEGAINRLAAAGITSGCTADRTKYCSSDFITRGQMAAFLSRALGYSDDGGGDLFVDDDTSEFELEIDKLATAGVTKGCNPPTNDRFCPNSDVTRGQMAAFLRRALG